MNLFAQISMYSNYSNLPNMFRCRKSWIVINMHAFLLFHCFCFNSVRPVFQNLVINTSQEYMFVEITKKYWENQEHRGEENKKRVVSAAMGSHVSDGIYSNNNTGVCFFDLHGNFIDAVNIYLEKTYILTQYFHGYRYSFMMSRIIHFFN